MSLTITPDDYVTMFTSKTLPQLADSSTVKLGGILGRFIRGVKDEDFHLLSDEPGKILSWVCTPELLYSILGKTPLEAMIHIGFSLTWIQNRLYDGTRHRLVVFPEEGGTVATWDNVLQLVKECYGEDIYEKVLPFQDAIKLFDYNESDADDTRTPPDLLTAKEIIRLSELSVHEKYNNPQFMTVERFRVIDAPSLTDVRAFYHHSVGCNQHFQGTGTNKAGQREILVRNKPLSEISGLKSIDLLVTEDDIETYMRHNDTITLEQSSK